MHSWVMCLFLEIIQDTIHLPKWRCMGLLVVFFFWDSLGIWHILAGLVGNDTDLQIAGLTKSAGSGAGHLYGHQDVWDICVTSRAKLCAVIWKVMLTSPSLCWGPRAEHGTAGGDSQEQSRGGQSNPSPCWPMLLLMQPKLWFIFCVVRAHCWIMLNFSSTSTFKSFSKLLWMHSLLSLH